MGPSAPKSPDMLSRTYGCTARRHNSDGAIHHRKPQRPHGPTGVAIQGGSGERSRRLHLPLRTSQHRGQTASPPSRDVTWTYDRWSRQLRALLWSGAVRRTWSRHKFTSSHALHGLDPTRRGIQDHDGSIPARKRVHRVSLELVGQREGDRVRDSARRTQIPWGRDGPVVRESRSELYEASTPLNPKT